MSIQIYFGIPGSGKTTHAARVVFKNLKRGVPTYSNVDIKGSIKIDANRDLGNVDISNADLIIDEAGIEFNSRAYKSLDKRIIQWLKLYRHYGIRNIYVYSQSYEDMDITLRRLSDELYIVRRTLIPFVHSVKRIFKRIGIDDDTHQIIDEYRFQLFGVSFFFAPKYWTMFDSWSAPPLPAFSLPVLGFDCDSRQLDRKLLISHYKALKRESSFFRRFIVKIRKVKNHG